MGDIAPPPEWAPRIWRDQRNNAYMQFPSGDVIRCDATEAGLSKALKLIPYVEHQQGFVSGNHNIADHTLRKPIKIAKRTERERLLKSASPTRRRAFQDALAKLGAPKEKERK